MIEQMGERESVLMKGFPGCLIIYKDTAKEEILYVNQGTIDLFECDSEKSFLTYVDHCFGESIYVQDRETVRGIIRNSKHNRCDEAVYARYRILTKFGKIRYIEHFGYPSNLEKYGKVYYVLLREITDNGGKSKDGTTRTIGIHQARSKIFELFNNVYRLDLVNNTLEVIQSEDLDDSIELQNRNITDAFEVYGNVRIHEDDLERFRRFMDMGTVGHRLEQTTYPNLYGLFRCRDISNNYTWNLMTLIPQDLNRTGYMIFGSLDIGTLLDEQTDHVFGYGPDKKAPKEEAKEELVLNAEDRIGVFPENLSKEVFWNNMMDMSNFGLFWKDEQRRFRGANQAFLDYYGFSSVEEILGKTDEDMGWHVDPEPFMRDEMRVLKKGDHIRGVRGNCIVHGVMRTLNVNKKPIYHEGKIVGLIGYFIDVTEFISAQNKWRMAAEVDELTGVLNRRGFRNAITKYKESYDSLQLDFVLIYIDMDGLEEINEKYGHEFGDNLLIRFATDIKRAIGTSSVVARLEGDEFLVVKQVSRQQEIHELQDKIRRVTEQIRSMNGIPCKVSVSMGASVFSEAKDLRSMIRMADERMIVKKTGKNKDEIGGDQ